MARPAAASTPTRKRRWAGAGSPPAASPRRGTTTGACPLCGVVFPTRMLPVHVNTVCAAEEGGGRALGGPRVRPPVTAPRATAAGSHVSFPQAPPLCEGGVGGTLGPAAGSEATTPADSGTAPAAARPDGPTKPASAPLRLVVQRVTSAHFHLSWSTDGADLCATWTSAAPLAAPPRRPGTAGAASPRPFRDVFTLALSPTTSLRLVLTADADVPVSPAPATGNAAAAAAAADAAGVLPGLLARHGRTLGRLPASLLKSALQKAIRRQRPRAAAVAALGLGARSSASDLLRRLTLIAVEDVAVWPAGYPPLVWLMMAAGRRAVLGGRVVDWVLYAAAVIAAGEVRDDHGDGPDCADGGVKAAGGADVVAKATGATDKGTQAAGTADASVEMRTQGHTKSVGEADGHGGKGASAAPGLLGTTTRSRVVPPTANAACLVGALQVRRVYGGSAGDVAMVAAAEAAWAARFAAATAAGGCATGPPALAAAAAAYARAAASVTARDVSLQALAVPTAAAAPLLPPGSVLLEAVDSHCSAMAEELADTLPDGVVRRLAEFIGEDPAAGARVVERALWRCRSGLNGRRQWVGGPPWGGGGPAGAAVADDPREPGGDPALMAYWEAAVRPAVDEWSRSFLATRGL